MAKGRAFTGLPAKAITKGTPFGRRGRGAVGNSSNGRVGGRIGAVKVRGKHLNTRSMASRKLVK